VLIADLHSDPKPRLEPRLPGLEADGQPPTSGKLLRDVRLIDYKVRVVNPRAGTAAKVRVVIESRDHDAIWSTVGVSAKSSVCRMQ
jgi:hypothetical protein